MRNRVQRAAAENLAVLNTLRSGKANVTSSYAIAKAVGVSQRSVGFIVSRLRLQGHLIGSIHGEGYYLIENRDELDATVEHIAARKRGIDRTINALYSAASDRFAA